MTPYSRPRGGRLENVMSRQFTLDELLLWQRKPRRKLPSKWWLVPIMLAFVGANVASFRGADNVALGFACILVVAAILTHFTMSMFRIILVDDPREQAVRDKLEKIPFLLQETALQLYGGQCPWKQGNNGWKLAAIECHEAHMPGDCPLCGGE